jgi:1-acyl-sn-glycerol-3-phosphate acyltransferase
MESYWDKLPRSGLRFQISYFGWAIWMLYSLVIANLIIVFSLPLQFISKLRYRKLCDWIGMNSWPFFIYSLEFIGRNKVTVYSTQAIPKRENVLVLSNHCSYADWLMTFALAYRKGIPSFNAHLM